MEAKSSANAMPNNTNLFFIILSPFLGLPPRYARIASSDGIKHNPQALRYTEAQAFSNYIERWKTS
jgi:hypothetical protein